jgi:hypothetical protein
MKLKRLGLALLAAASLTLPSCIQSDQNTMINPDGSGKFKLSLTMDLGQLMQGLEGLGGGAGKMKEDPMEQMLKELVSKTEGVDVWSQAKLEKDDAGKSKVVVEGYFKDVNKLKMGSGKGETGDFGSISSSKDADGNWILDVGGFGGDEAAAAPKDAPQLTEAEVKEKIQMMKDQMGMMKGMMEAMMGSAKMDSTITVGGTIEDYGVLQKVTANSGSVSMKPAKMFEAMEKLLNDPEKAKVLASMGDDPMQMLKGQAAKQFGKEIMEAMVGRAGSTKLKIKAGEPLFDYAKESAEAAAKQTPELKALLEKGSKGGNKVKLPKAA